VGARTGADARKDGLGDRRQHGVVLADRRPQLDVEPRVAGTDLRHHSGQVLPHMPALAQEDRDHHEGRATSGGQLVGGRPEIRRHHLQERQPDCKVGARRRDLGGQPLEGRAPPRIAGAVRKQDEAPVHRPDYRRATALHMPLRPMGIAIDSFWA